MIKLEAGGVVSETIHYFYHLGQQLSENETARPSFDHTPPIHLVGQKSWWYCWMTIKGWVLEDSPSPIQTKSNMHRFVFVMLAAVTNLRREALSCTIPPYAELSNSDSFLPRSELDGLILEGRCFLGCLDSDPTSYVRFHCM